MKPRNRNRKPRANITVYVRHERTYTYKLLQPRYYKINVTAQYFINHPPEYTPITHQPYYIIPDTLVLVHFRTMGNKNPIEITLEEWPA